MTRNTLPLTVGHLNPCIGKALSNIETLSRSIGALTLESSRGDCRIAKYRHLHVVVIDAGIFGRFRCCQRLGLIVDFPITAGGYELVSEQWRDQVRVVCLLGLKPLLF